MEEIWKDVAGYEGLYQVSNMGRVWSTRSKKLLVPKDDKGYYRVGLCISGKTKKSNIHRLVASAFVENPDDKPQVNHKDGNKHNNCANNLEWATAKENTEHAWKTGLVKNLHPFKGCKHSDETRRKMSEIATGKIRWENWPRKKIVLQCDLQGNFIKKWNGFNEIERETGYNKTNVCACCNGRKKIAYGYIWKYERG